MKIDVGNRNVSDKRPYILITNDDGINSAGLYAAAEAAILLGDVIVVAPNQQYSSVGRAMPPDMVGMHKEIEFIVARKLVKAYAVSAYPAPTVHYAIEHKLVERFPNLVISGINYGLNVGAGVGISGTVGAAMEAGSRYGIPSIAVSLETPDGPLNSQPENVDFKVAVHFTRLFAKKLLDINEHQKGFDGDDIDVIKVEIPKDAKVETPWEVTRVSRQQYWVPKPVKRKDLSTPGPIEWIYHVDSTTLELDSDTAAVILRKHVAVTPLTSDMTSRTNFQLLQKSFEEPNLR